MLGTLVVLIISQPLLSCGLCAPRLHLPLDPGGPSRLPQISWPFCIHAAPYCKSISCSTERSMQSAYPLAWNSGLLHSLRVISIFCQHDIQPVRDSWQCF